MALRFSLCPTWWTRDRLGFKRFGGGVNTGRNISALKCILAISTSIDFHTRKAKLSISELEKLTGLSRPMVIKGLQLLDSSGIIIIDKTMHVHEYELTLQDGDNRWGKIPHARVTAQLPEINNRGVVSLTALKIYLLLISLRMNNSHSVAIGYDKILDYLGCQRRHIRPALDILYSHTLIRIKLEESDGLTSYNVYTILGL